MSEKYGLVNEFHGFFVHFSFEIKEKHDRRTSNLFFLQYVNQKKSQSIYFSSFDKQFKIVLGKVTFIKNEINVIKTGPS